MVTLTTPLDFGNTIRQRRKKLGWDQARLAHEIGVSRQWVIDMEKGKPRAELHLVLRALKALDLRLSLDDGQTRPAATTAPQPDLIDTIARRNTPHRLVTTILGNLASAKSDRDASVQRNDTPAALARRAARHLADQGASYEGKAGRLPAAADDLRQARAGKVRTANASKASLPSSRGDSARSGKKPR